MRLSKGGKNIPDDQIDLIFELYKSGKNCTDIKKDPRIKVSYLLIRKALSRAFNLYY